VDLVTQAAIDGAGLAFMAEDRPRAPVRSTLRPNHYVARKYSADQISVIESLENLATKNDVDQLGARLTGLFQQFFAGLHRGSTSTREAVRIGASMVSTIVGRST